MLPQKDNKAKKGRKSVFVYINNVLQNYINVYIPTKDLSIAQSFLWQPLILKWSVPPLWVIYILVSTKINIFTV